MVMVKLSVPGCFAGLVSGGARDYCVCGGRGLGLFGRFCSRLSLLFFLPVWETVRYKLKYCSKGRKTQNNQLNVATLATFLTTQKYAMLEYVNQKLHGVRENKADHVCM